MSGLPMRIPPTKGDIQKMAKNVSYKVKKIHETINEERRTFLKIRSASFPIALAGGAVAIVGAVAGILTLGVGTVIAAAGGAIAAGGAVTFTAASVMSAIYKKIDIDKIEMLWKDFSKTLLESHGIYFESELMARAALLYMDKVLQDDEHDINKVKLFFERGPSTREIDSEVGDYINQARMSLLEAKESKEFVDKVLFTIQSLIWKLLKKLEDEIKSRSRRSTDKSDPVAPLNMLVEFLDMISEDKVGDL